MIRGLNLIVALALFIIMSGNYSHSQEGAVDPVVGKTVYEKHCLRCHGPTGAGDGPEAGSLIVKPVNFQSAESRSKTDEEMRSAIIWGFAFSPMHGWWSKLSREEIWSVIFYIRQMAPYRPEAS